MLSLCVFLMGATQAMAQMSQLVANGRTLYVDVNNDGVFTASGSCPSGQTCDRPIVIGGVGNLGAIGMEDAFSFVGYQEYFRLLSEQGINQTRVFLDPGLDISSDCLLCIANSCHGGETIASAIDNLPSPSPACQYLVRLRTQDVTAPGFDPCAPTGQWNLNGGSCDGPSSFRYPFVNRNLTSYDTEFWGRVDRFLDFADAAGVYVELVAFNPWDIKNGDDNGFGGWCDSPWNQGGVGQYQLYTTPNAHETEQNAFLSQLVSVAEGGGTPNRNMYYELNNEDVGDPGGATNPSNAWLAQRATHLTGRTSKLIAVQEYGGQDCSSVGNCSYASTHLGSRRGANFFNWARSQGVPAEYDEFTVGIGGNQAGTRERFYALFAAQGSASALHFGSGWWKSTNCGQSPTSLLRGIGNFVALANNATLFSSYSPVRAFSELSNSGGSCPSNPNDCVDFTRPGWTATASSSNLYYFISGNVQSGATNNEFLIYLSPHSESGTNGGVIQMTGGGITTGDYYHVYEYDPGGTAPLSLRSSTPIQVSGGALTVSYPSFAATGDYVLLLKETNAAGSTNLFVAPAVANLAPSCVSKKAVGPVNLRLTGRFSTLAVANAGTKIDVRLTQGGTTIDVPGVLRPTTNPNADVVEFSVDPLALTLGSWSVRAVNPITGKQSGTLPLTVQTCWCGFDASMNSSSTLDGEDSGTLNVTFQNTSSASQLAQYSWEFGDGATRNTFGATPVVHTYSDGTAGLSQSGLFSVKLSIDDGAGCQTSITMEDFVHVHKSSQAPRIITGVGPGSVSGLYGSLVHGFYPRASSGGPLEDTVMAGHVHSFPYGAPKYGGNVAGGRIAASNVCTDPCRQGCTPPPANLLTGPGPGDVYGPHVRGFELTPGAGGGLTPLAPPVSFYAYGTLKFGVKVNAGDVDRDGISEIITGAGPGAVFGPHVRGWQYDGVGVAPIAGISFFAYGTLKWGVNVGSGDVDGDGYEEMVTGPGPGAGFGPHVRGWNRDCASGCAAQPMGKISFPAFSAGGVSYGATVAAGDDDGDGYDEILAGMGPRPDGFQMSAWNFDGTAIVAQVVGTPIFPTPYGVNVAMGDLSGPPPPCGPLCLQPAPERAIAATGPDPSAPPNVVGRKVVTGGAGSFDLLSPPVDVIPYVRIGGVMPGYGATVGSVPCDERFADAASTQSPIVQAHQGLEALRELVARTPDSSTIDYSLDPDATVDINVWSSDADKASALADLFYLSDNLADLDATTIVARLQQARGTIAAGLLNEFARTEILGELDALLARYTSGELCSGAVVARLPLPQSGTFADLETSALTPGSFFLASSQSATTFDLSEISTSSLQVVSQATFAGSLHDLEVSVADRALLGIRCGDPAAGCPPGQLCPSMLRQPLGRDMASGAASQDLGLAASSPIMPLGGPSPRRPRGPARALTHCSIAGQRVVALVEDLDRIPAAPQTVIPHGTQEYHAFADSPLRGDSRVFAIHDGGIDAIDTEATTIQEDAVVGLSGQHLESTTLSTGDALLVALDDTSGVISLADPSTGAVLTQVLVPGAIVIEPLPRRDRVVVLTGNSLVLLDAGTGRLRRTLPICPGGTGFSLTADGTRALVTNASSSTVDVVLIGPEDLGAMTRDVAAVFESLEDSAFSAGHAVLGCQSVEGSGQGSVASEGFGGPAGHVASNGSIDLTGNAMVDGDVVLGPSGTARIKGNAVVTGDVVTGERPFNCAPLGLARVRARFSAANDNGDVPLTAQGRSVWRTSALAGDFDVNGGDAAELPEGTYFMTELTVGEGSSVTVTGPVTIFLTGALDISDQSSIVAQPGPVLVLSDFTGTHRVADASVEAVIYSPSARIRLTGGQSAEVEGSIWAEDVSVSGQGQVLRSLGLEAGALRSWLTAELLRLADDIDAALLEEDPALRNPALDAILAELIEILERMDGFVGGDPTDDWFRVRDDQALLFKLVRDLMTRLEARILPVPGPPPTFPE